MELLMKLNIYGISFAEEPESGDRQKKQTGNPHIELRKYHPQIADWNIDYILENIIDPLTLSNCGLQTNHCCQFFIFSKFSNMF